MTSAQMYASVDKTKEYDFGQPINGNAAEYPEAAHYTEEPAVGEPLYGPQPSGNPHLRRFVKKGWKDVWAAVLFIVTLTLLVVLGLINLTSSNTDTTQTGAENSLSRSQLAAGVMLPVILSCSTSAVGIALMSWKPKAFIYIANILAIGLLILWDIVILQSNIVIGLICIAFTGVYIAWFMANRSMIPFTAEVLKSATRVLATYKGQFVVAVLMLGALSLFSLFCGAAVVRPLKHAQQDKTTGFDTFVFLFTIFMVYWVMQVLPNVMMTTTAGVTATWYFVGVDNMPPNPTMKSFIRSITTSFGSICFGSLLVATIQFMRFLLNYARSQEDFNFLTCCLDCLLAWIEGLVEFFNTYAYVHIAMYGYDYMTSAKHSMELFQQCPSATVFTNCLVDQTTAVLALAFSLTVTLISGAALQSIGVAVLAFFVSLVVHNIFFTTVRSAAITMFVCYAEVPEALRVTDPELYAIFQENDGGVTNNIASV